jgi:hypothetical protein
VENTNDLDIVAIQPVDGKILAHDDLTNFNAEIGANGA